MPSIASHLRFAFLVAFSAIGLVAPRILADEIDFGLQVQPIFAKHCVACHGPDEAESGLRLTKHKSVLGELDSGEQAIVPGDVGASELFRRITSDDESERMPPEGKPLAAEEIAVIKKWIEQGAPWKKHWGFVPPQRHEPPTVAQKDWARVPFDAFVLKKLEDNELSPAPEANAIELMRRAYYDVTGLPPTPEEVQAYEKADPHVRYEQLVDRLLESKHFGERWGRHWLDLVRFAETNSYERDGPKPEAWRYRDYVIRSFNDDKPYDQFLIEQLAGDELPNPTAESITATGYYRLGLWDDEPADRELAKYDGLDDIVSTTGQVMLGLTVNCARCHDHKIDPIPQADYYGMLSFFRNVTHYGPQHHILRPLFVGDGQKAEYDRKVKQLEDERNAAQVRVDQFEKNFLTAYQSKSKEDVGMSDIDDLKFAFYRDTWDTLPDFPQLKAETVGKVPGNRFDTSLATRENSFGFVFEGFLKVPTKGEFTFELDSDDGARLTVDAKKLIEYDGIHGLGGVKKAKLELNAGRVPIRLEYFQAHGGQGLMVAWSGPEVERRLLSAESGEQAKINIRQLIRSEGERVLGKDGVKEYAKLRRDLQDLKRKNIPMDRALAVTEHGNSAPDTFIFTRGSPHAPAEKVEPHFPEIFNAAAPVFQTVAEDAKTTGRRMVLAKWIASPDNMQTSRVMVNRIWQHLFGRGIVRSASNFGILGTPPTHSELLDWLSFQFTDMGWSVKSMIRQVMLSSSYRMSSRADEKALAADPTNNLFWRQNMRRLSAEELRDSVLAVNGRLNTEMFGPSIYPKIPKEVLAGQSRPGSGWGNSSPEQQARRSVYVYVKRSLLVPILESFDFSETDSSCPIRFNTTQPTQALGLLNSEFSNEQAKVLAERIKNEVGEDVRSQVKRALWLVTQRNPHDEEINKAVELIDDLKSKDGTDDDRALQTFCLLALNLNEFVYLD